ncbi:MAG: DUF1501 domain-containing protein [Nannocystaceae bacterium]|nr:DUF1501 domain-containing protein [Nannocystaceae bacterium]
MDRRDFLKMAGAAGMAVGAASLYPRAQAGLSGGGTQAGPYQGPLFCFFQAVGGWDPTHLCDPKGNELNAGFGEGDILSVGDINYAPIPGATEFFTAHGSYMTVINGMDVQTNSHDAGRRNMTSGRLAEGYPNLAALIAGAGASGLPMAFLTFGGYEFTGSTVPPTRDGNQARLTELAYPHQTNPGNLETPAYYMSTAARDMLEAAKEERANAIADNQRLPRFSKAVNTLITSVEGADQLKLLDEIMPEPDANPEFRKIQLAVAAYKAGVGATANFAMGGFDTHSNHDAAHIPRLTNMMAQVDFLFAEAERQGVADQVIATMASDFGRTPNYNGGNGKDHWRYTSMIVLGKDVPGNRTIGRSDMGHYGIPLDPDTLEEAENPDEGFLPEPAHVHLALRKQFGVEDSVLAELYPLSVEHSIKFFG